jgi:hypothetical protein
MKPTQKIPIEQLWLDEENPRLRSMGVGNSQQELLKALYTNMSVDEVAMSIAANGYFDEEPLFVVEDSPARKGTKKSYTVVEGNRRLAAVKLLTSDDLRKVCKASDLPDLTTPQVRALQAIPCVIYPERRELWQYLGFRHINGVKPWDAYSKALYVAEVHEKYKVPLDEIASDIGDRHTTVRRLYRGLTVLRQAEKSGFSREDIAKHRFFFSHLYTAVDQPEFQEFLSIDADRHKTTPVPTAKKADLIEFMTWLYGSKARGLPPVVQTQNPDLNLLREVIGNPPALAALRRGASISRAHEISRGDARRFSDAVFACLEELREANALFSSGFDAKTPSLVDAIEKIGEEAERLVSQFASKKPKTR